MMKKVLLALALAYIVEHTPWTLLGLMGETLVMKPGLSRMVKGQDKYWETRALELRLTAMGWKVSYTPHLTNGVQEVYGVTDTNARTIEVDAELEWTARYGVLAHEGGHALQNVTEWIDDAAGEAFAEAVATLVARDGLREHARYLANHKLALLNALVFKHEDIYRAAALLQE